MEGWAALFVFMLAAFAGYEVIGRVPVILHTPLMSGSNFVHGIVLVGAMVALGEAQSTAQRVIGFIAVLLGTANAVGGFVVTDRMLEMFKSSRDRAGGRSAPAGAGETSVAASARAGTSASTAADSEPAGDG
jgi:NAD(P) transhydrogenase subunit alpha